MTDLNELKQLGRYQLLGVLGRGTAGLVFEGLDPILNRRVAIKAIRLRQPDDRVRFMTEAQALAKLSHPHIVTVFDFGEDQGVLYLVMELIAGEDLASYFDDSQLFTLDFTLDDSVRIVCELLDALDYAHQHGIIHRDIKPANVVLTDQLHVKLTDFGMAHTLPGGHTQQVAGTPAYRAPEQVLGQPASPATDIFAAGVILYQFLAGAHPFNGPDLSALQQQIAYGPVAAPGTYSAVVGPSLDQVALRALAKQPASRYPSASAFRSALLRALADNAAPSGASRP